MESLPPITRLLEASPGNKETFATLLELPGARLEHIISRGDCSPDDFWYDQDSAEWVMLLQGEAQLRFEESAGICELKAGDALTIPAHTKHRVDYTSKDAIWLALHYTE